MGLLDGMQQQMAPQEQMGGLLGGAPQPQGGGLPPMPPEMTQMIQQVRQQDPQTQQAFVEKIVQAIQQKGGDPAMVEAATQQFIQAMQG